MVGSSMWTRALCQPFTDGRRVWSGAVNRRDTSHQPIYYIRIYALVRRFSLWKYVSTCYRFPWLDLSCSPCASSSYVRRNKPSSTSSNKLTDSGSIQVSDTLHKRLLKSVLFAPIRFHDTTNRGRLLNRFGKDFEGIDSSLADNFGRRYVSRLGINRSSCSLKRIQWRFPRHDDYHGRVCGRMAFLIGIYYSLRLLL